MDSPEGLDYLKRVSCRVHTETEGFVERRFTVMTTHPGLFLDDSFLSGNVHHIELHVEVCGACGQR